MVIAVAAKDSSRSENFRVEVQRILSILKVVLPVLPKDGNLSDATMNLDEEVRLYTTNIERERTENLATLYSIIVSLEYLERAYVRDSVTGKEYVPPLTTTDHASVKLKAGNQVRSGVY